MFFRIGTDSEVLVIFTDDFGLKILPEAFFVEYGLIYLLSIEKNYV
jgi:hypothetical protein